VNNLTPFAIVVDRVYAKKKPQSLRKAMCDLGGCWEQMYELWRETGSPYLVLLCHTPERIKSGAPLTSMPVDDDELRRTLTYCCVDLTGQSCKWLLLMQPHSTGREITQSILLLDMVTEGSA